MTTRTPEELEEKLHYHFKNKELLITALTHSSYANESKTPTLYNERLEFLGDSVLSVVVANYLFHHSTRPEGELSRMRASLVSEDALFQFAQEIDLGSYLRLGRGEELGGGRCRPSVVSDAFEATIAALFLDGGIETARNFILPFITEGKTAEDDHKTALQEVVQKHPDPGYCGAERQGAGCGRRPQQKGCGTAGCQSGADQAGTAGIKRGIYALKRT